MCGIAGYIAKGSGGPIPQKLKAMVDAVAHRGPDDEGIRIRGDVGLGHRRLSIIDPSPAGHQPMPLAEHNLAIVFNGEIYNYVELRKELGSLGFRSSTGTDTEVILLAYACWGMDCIDRFNGMWSFAIHDERRRIVFCSRDRFGVKPFYYSDTKNEFVFGSEIRQLLSFQADVRANRPVLLEYLLAGTTEPIVETFYEGIHKLPGGHSLVYDLNRKDYRITRYYELKACPTSIPINLEDAVSHYGNLLEDSISLRLRSDVPVGTCLSGGLDSSSIATVAAGKYREKCGHSFRAITAVSEMASSDESGFARLVADHSGMEWIPIKPAYQDFARHIGEIVKAQEEPFGSASIAMQFFVMKAARQNNIPVLLDGQGGDETLLGYERYYVGNFLNLIRQYGWAEAVRSLGDARRNNEKMTTLGLLLFLLYFSTPHLRYLNYRHRSRHLRQIPPMPAALRANAKAILNVQDMQVREIMEDNLPALLRFEDKNSMWHSIECRLPFLDYRCVEAAVALPSFMKIHEGWTKYALRSFMDKKMPAAITWRKNKFGFEAPERIWFARHAKIMKDEILSSKLIQSLCHARHIDSRFASLNSLVQWRLYNTALWEKEFSVH